MAGDSFDKDFGYLMPFLDKIAEAAGSVSDPAAREELSRLMAGEKQRWTRIRQLLSGAAGAAASAEKSSTQKISAARAESATGKIQQESAQSFHLTVGSLRRREP